MKISRRKRKNFFFSVPNLGEIRRRRLRRKKKGKEIFTFTAFLSSVEGGEREGRQKLDQIGGERRFDRIRSSCGLLKFSKKSSRGSPSQISLYVGSGAEVADAQK